MVLVPASRDYVEEHLVCVRPVNEVEINSVLGIGSAAIQVHPLLAVDRDGYDVQILYVFGTVFRVLHLAKHPDGERCFDPMKTGWVVGGAWCRVVDPNRERVATAVYDWARNSGYSELFLDSVFQYDLTPHRTDWWTCRVVHHLSIAPSLIPAPLQG